MPEKKSRQLAREIINKEKWWDLLSRFIDVLRINMFIVDRHGLIVLPPEEDKYGGKLLTDPSRGFDLLHTQHFLEQFKAQGKYLESINRFNLRSFAIPIKYPKDHIIAYLIVGPLILNKRLISEQYDQLAHEHHLDINELTNEINEIRVVSNVMLNSILDLLTDIIRDNVQLSLATERQQPPNLSQAINQVADEIYATVRLDELLATLLDTALKMTETECGSIMIQDDKTHDLTIKVSRGLDPQKLEHTRVKLGEGICGLAAKENASFLINGQQGDHRISHLLKRSDIKHSLVMPLVKKNKTYGILNLHTKKDVDHLSQNLDNLQYLSQLLSSAF